LESNGIGLPGSPTATTQTVTASTEDAPAAPDCDPGRAEPAAMTELRGLLARARQGDESALPRLREMLDGHPEVWGWYGDLAVHVQASYINQVSGADLGLAESLHRKVAALKAELAGTAPTPIERLLAERVAACWIEVHWADGVVAQARDVSIRQA